ncbi:MAG TPA: Rieske (2Fe-2S) protein [Microlunatus sp.]|nr:Rieske (2Fe-2S) protein [Microlunatus sp.]
MTPRISRRQVLIGGGLSTLAVCGFAGCASYGPEAQPSTPPPASTLTVPAAEIPVGGGRVFNPQRVVVTQPTAGNFLAFSAVCTHQGCTVAQVTATIDCPCHGSRFAITDGSVVNGPSTEALPGVPIHRQGDQLTVG